MSEHTEWQDLKVKETATLEKFEMVEGGRKLVEKIIIQDGTVISRKILKSRLTEG